MKRFFSLLAVTLLCLAQPALAQTVNTPAPTYMNSSGTNRLAAQGVVCVNPTTALFESCAGGGASTGLTDTELRASPVIVSRADGVAITTTAGTAVNAILFNVDTLGYDFVGFQLRGTFAGTVTFEASDDNATWVSVVIKNEQTGMGSVSTTSAGLYSYFAQHRYFRARVSTFTSGSFQSSAYLRSGPTTGFNVVTLSGTSTITGSVTLNGATNTIGAVLPLRVTNTRTNGTVAVANTFQTALALNASRNGCRITNTSANIILMDVGATPLAAIAIPIPAGGTFFCNVEGVVLTDLISVTSATAGSTFVVWTH
jgi:hypothetical protein